MYILQQFRHLRFLRVRMLIPTNIDPGGLLHGELCADGQDLVCLLYNIYCRNTSTSPPKVRESFSKILISFILQSPKACDQRPRPSHRIPKYVHECFDTSCSLSIHDSQIVIDARQWSSRSNSLHLHHLRLEKNRLRLQTLLLQTMYHPIIVETGVEEMVCIEVEVVAMH